MSDIRDLAVAVDEDPSDGNRLRRLAQALVKGRAKDAATLAYGLAGRAFSVAGQLPMALVVAKELGWRDQGTSAQLVDDLGRAFGKGSPLVDAALRRQPPPPPPSHHDQRAALPAADDEAVAEALDRVSARLGAIGQPPLPAWPLFHALGPALFRRLSALSRVREPRAGEVVFSSGTAGDTCYVVARGSVGIVRGGTAIGRLGPGAFFGEMALLTDSPRSASAICETDCVLLELARRAVDELAAAEREFATVLADHARDRLLANLLATSQLFQNLPSDLRAGVASRFATQTLEEGATLLEEGKPNETLHVVVSGELAVEKKAGALAVPVTQLGPGDVVGEISVLTGKPATATVRATRRTILLSLRRNNFREITGAHPALLAHLEGLADRRERELERLLVDEILAIEDLIT